MSFDIEKTLESIAPTLAAMLGGPLAGTAVTALESALGLSPGAGTDGITQVLQSGAMTPDMIAAVRKADQEHADRLAQMQVDLAKLNASHQEALAATDVTDRVSARSMEVSTRSYLVPALALLIVGGFLGMVAATLGGYSRTDGALAGTLIGYLSAKAEQVVAFYFGSTAGSQAQVQMIHNSTPNAPSK